MNLLKLKPFFTLQYLFQINSAYISPQEKLFFLAGAILVLLAIVVKIAAVLAPSPVDQRFREKFYVLFLSVGLGELLWYACRYENVAFFGSRFVALLIGLIGVVWLIGIFASIIRNYKSEKTVWDKQQVKLKYLPK